MLISVKKHSGGDDYKMCLVDLESITVAHESKQDPNWTAIKIGNGEFFTICVSMDWLLEAQKDIAEVGRAQHAEWMLIEHRLLTALEAVTAAIQSQSGSQ